MWESKARGKSVGPKTVLSVEAMKLLDFIIASSGDALHTNIDNAYKAGIPCIYTLGTDPKAKALQGTLAPDSWKAEKGVSADLDKAVEDLFVGGWKFSSMRVVSGFMADVHLYDLTRKVNGIWFKEYNDWFLEKLEDLTGLNNKNGKFRKYVFARYNLLEGSNAVYSGNDKTTVQTFFYNSQKNISTLFISPVDSNGLPTATKLDLPYNDSSSCPWKFWLYHEDEIGCLDVLFNGTKTQLHTDLGYTTTSGSAGSNGDNGSDGNSENNGDNGDQSNSTPDNTNYSARIAVALESIAKSMKNS